MNFKRKVRLFFVTYGRLLFTILAIIAGIIYGIQKLNNYAIEKKKTEVISEDEKVIFQQKTQESKKEKEIISQFIDSCNLEKYEEAYKMLADNSKKEKYTTIDEFRDKFIKKYFNLKIYDYKIQKEKDIYIITLTEDMLSTGKTDSTKQIKVKYSNVEKKIYIY